MLVYSVEYNTRVKTGQQRNLQIKVNNLQFARPEIAFQFMNVIFFVLFTFNEL